MRFLRSEFRGQLPGRYREDLPLQQATSMNRPNEFNDMNLEEESRYVSRIHINNVIFCILYILYNGRRGRIVTWDPPGNKIAARSAKKFFVQGSA